MTKLQQLITLLNEPASNDADFAAIQKLLMLMQDADDSNISFSDDNIGINVANNEINIVDIEKSVAIATITLKII